MRLLSVGSLPPELGGAVRGGVATFHATLLEGLKGAGSGIEVVGIVPPAPLEREVDLPIVERPADVPLAPFYEDLLERVRPDVVLMNHIAHTIGVTHARLDAPPPALGIVHSWHNISFAEPDEIARRYEVTEEALTGLEALVVGSRHCLEEGRRLGLSYPSIAEAIHYSLQPLYLDPSITVDKGERTGVLFLGSLTSRKNPNALIEAAALLPDLGITLAGVGELDTKLRESIARLDLQRQVRIVGHFPHGEHLEGVRDLLLGAQAMCLPSSSESFGLAYIEALACGTPVVGFGPTIREIRDAMGVEIGVALDDPAPESIAAAVAQVLATDWDRDALRRAAVDTFHPRTTTERYVDVLSRTLTGRERAKPRSGSDREQQ